MAERPFTYCAEFHLLRKFHFVEISLYRQFYGMLSAFTANVACVWPQQSVEAARRLPPMLISSKFSFAFLTVHGSCRSMQLRIEKTAKSSSMMDLPKPLSRS